MNIPFVSHLRIEEQDEQTLKPACLKNVINHIGTIHAAVQFALAETQSGLYLTSVFPQYQGKFLPLVRSSTITLLQVKSMPKLLLKALI